MRDVIGAEKSFENRSGGQAGYSARRRARAGVDANAGTGLGAMIGFKAKTEAKSGTGIIMKAEAKSGTGIMMRARARRVLAVLMVFVVLATGSVSAAGSTDGDIKIYRSEALFLAHKGFSAVAPENTLPAIREAVRAGFGGVEIDVYETKDKTKGYKPYILVSHDKTLTRLTGKAVSIKDLNHANKYYYPIMYNINGLQKYGAQYFPTLEEALNTAWSEANKYGRKDFVVEIEIKGNMSKAGLKKIIRLAGKHNVRITTTKYGIVKKLRKYRKHKSTRIWMYKEPKPKARKLFIKRAKKVKADGVSMPATYWTPGLIKFAKTKHMKLAAITQSKAQARRLINAGFNRICCDWKMFE